jgi:hypothetical protein
MRSMLRFQLFNHVVNPVVRSAVRHLPHGRLADVVALLTYEGRVSGRTFTIPVEYAEGAPGQYLIVPGDPEHKTWWRNFRRPMTVQLLVGGRPLSGKAALLTDPAERRAALDLYFRRFPTAARRYHLAKEPDGGFGLLRLEELTDRLVVLCVEAEA